MSLTSVLLPEPETPVTHTRPPSGKRASMSFKLWARAPTTSSVVPWPARRVAGTGIERSPARYRPVSEAGTAATSAGVPAATSRPPCRPAAGPRSTT